MYKENSNTIKKNKKKSIKRQLTKQKNPPNETEEKLVITTKNELTCKDNDNLQDLSNTYKNLDVILSNKLESLRKNQENKQTTSSLIKNNNNSNSINTLIKQKKEFSKQ